MEPVITWNHDIASFACMTVSNDAHNLGCKLLQTARAVLVKGETVAKLKVAINGFGRIGRNFLRCWHGRKDSPLEVLVVNDSGGVKNVRYISPLLLLHFMLVLSLPFQVSDKAFSHRLLTFSNTTPCLAPSKLT